MATAEIAIDRAIGPSDDGDALHKRDGWHVNHKRVARIWRRD